MNFRLWLTALAFALCFSAIAQTNTAPRVQPGSANRWLLVLETSKAMRERAGTALNIATALVGSGMNGQMQPGDTLGIWTFNETLQVGEFPLQLWATNHERIVTRRVYQFIETRTFDKGSRVDRVIPEVQRLIKNSEFITIILITAGEEPIKGTAFDQKINTAYKQWRTEQRKQNIPFVTLLRATRGAITHAIVNTPPYPMEWPPLPEELQKQAEPPPPAVAAEPPPEEPEPPRVIGQPLIISGRKTEPKPSEPANTGETGGVPVAAKEPATPAAPPEAAKPAPVTPRVVYTAPPESTAAPGAEPVAKVQTAVTTPAAPLKKNSGTKWVAIGTSLTLLFVLLARRKKRARGSLITRSLDGQNQ